MPVGKEKQKRRNIKKNCHYPVGNDSFLIWLNVVCRMALPVCPFAVFLEAFFLFFNGLNDLFLEGEDGTSDRAGSGDDTE